MALSNQNKQKLARAVKFGKASVKGVVGAGVATVIATGPMGILPLLALPVAAAGVLYAKSKAAPETKAQKATVWGTIAGVGLATAGLMHGFEMVPTASAVLFALTTAAPIIGNQIMSRLTKRRAAGQGVIETRPVDPRAQMPQSRADGTFPKPEETVSVQVPANMAEQVARFVESIKGQAPAQPEDTQPRRTNYRPS